MQTPEHLNELFDRFTTGQATDAEKQEVRDWFRSQLREEVIIDAPQGYTEADLMLRMKHRLDTSMPGEAKTIVPSVHRVHFLKTTWFRYAAILLLLAASATYIIYTNTTHPIRTLAGTAAEVPGRLPGSNKATLTLSDGSIIALDTAGTGNLAEQGNTKIIKLNNGSLAYNTAGVADGSPGYNTISTPRGGQYQVVLADGTRVWLNAASSIRFPAAFAKNARELEVTGEAYFEVAPNKSSTFKVTANGTQIAVLGTSFNINAYDDESATRTTLREGSVKVSYNEFNVLLKPGEQSSTNGKDHHIQKVNTEEVLAWKNGFFNFKNAGLETVMRQLSRWYDIEVKYTGAVPVRSLTGELQRSLTLDQMLEALHDMEVHFKMEGKTLLVMP